MALCESCENLRTLSKEFWDSGVTENVCQALRIDEGFNKTNFDDDYEAMVKAVDCLIGALRLELASMDVCDWKTATERLMDNIYKLMHSYNCIIAGLWDAIYELLELIRSIQGGQYHWMVKNRDYTIQWYNGWYSTEGATDTRVDDIDVGYITAMNQYTMRFRQNSSTKRLKNDSLIGNEVTLRHTNPADAIEKSWIYGIRFINNFSFLNDYTYVGGNYNGGTGIINIGSRTGTNPRASWQSSMSPSHNYGGNKILTTWVSFADGYNSQLSVYNDSTLYTALCNHSFDFVLLNPE